MIDAIIIPSFRSKPDIRLAQRLVLQYKCHLLLLYSSQASLEAMTAGLAVARPFRNAINISPPH